MAGLVSALEAAADTRLADALARTSDKDVAALRTNLADPATRCTLGAVYAKRGDLSRAALYLVGCDEAELPTEIAASITRIERDTRKRLRDSDLAMIEVVSTPAGMTATIDALPGETFITPTTLYLSPGEYQVQAASDGLVLRNVVHAEKRSRGAVLLDAGGHVVAPATQPKQKTIDMSENGGAVEDGHTGPPPAVKHENMISEKYKLGIDAVASADHPGALEDPMAVREHRRRPRAYWLGVRIGGGMFDDGEAAARAGVATAATARFPLAGRTFLTGRLDWSRRGGERETAVDVVGFGAGAGATVVDTKAIGLAVLAQVRGDLRLASRATMAMVDVPVSRAGATVAAGLELALPRTPFTAGVRFEQGLTTLLPNVRDRALLFELGVDWR